MTVFNHYRILIPLMLLFWLITLVNLARYPGVHYDEPVIVSPGYKLFQQGVYGADMYTGFYNQEQVFLEVPPTMSLIQGVMTLLIGVGVWQMRYTAVIIGLLLLPLVYIVGRRLTGHQEVGLLAAFLLLFWRWTPGGHEFLGSGILFLDVARIARYDILVPVFGLLGFYAWLNRRHFRAGLWLGLSGFSNIYGLFWLPAMGLLYLLDPPNLTHLRDLPRHVTVNFLRVKSNLLKFIVASSVPWIFWLAVLLVNWESATGQFIKHDGRFDLFNPTFYWHNLITEINRYGLGFRDIASYGRIGFWFVAVGIPIGIIWLIYRLYHYQDRRALYLFIPLFTIPTLLGLLVSLKRHYYLMIILPLAAILLAWLSHYLYQKKRRWLTGLLITLLTLFALQGAWGMRQLHNTAQKYAPSFPFYADLASRLPAEGRIMASNVYWPILADRDFRSLTLLFMLTNPINEDPLPFAEALLQIRPDILILDETFAHDLFTSEAFTGQPRYQPFWDFMDTHNAQLIDQLVNPQGALLEIYQLEWQDE